MTIRHGLESLKIIAAALGGTLEEAADFCDRWRALNGKTPTPKDAADTRRTIQSLTDTPVPPGKVN